MNPHILAADSDNLVFIYEESPFHMLHSNTPAAAGLIIFTGAVIVGLMLLLASSRSMSDAMCVMPLLLALVSFAIMGVASLVYTAHIWSPDPETAVAQAIGAPLDEVEWTSPDADPLAEGTDAYKRHGSVKDWLDEACLAPDSGPVAADITYTVISPETNTVEKTTIRYVASGDENACVVAPTAEPAKAQEGKR